MYLHICMFKGISLDAPFELYFICNIFKFVAIKPNLGVMKFVTCCSVIVSLPSVTWE